VSRIDDLLDVLKVEVEEPSAGLRNLLANPSGDLGAWAWATDVGVLATGTDVGGTYLEFRTDPVAQGPYSELIPCAAGQYISATWEAIAADGLYVRAWFRWYDAAGVLSGTYFNTSVASAWSNATGQRFAVAPVVAPATTVAARLVFQVAATNTATAPAAGKKFRYRKAIAATAATAAELGPVYTNLVTNPSFETNTTGWQVTATPITGGAAGTGNIARVAAAAIVGAWGGRLTRTSGPRVSVLSPEFAVTPGRQYRASLKHTADPAGTYFGVAYYSAAHAFIGIGATPMNVFGVTTEEGLTWVAPAGAWYGRIFYETAALTVDLDAAMMLPDGTAGTSAYFDGATPDTAGVDYSWTGVAHASSSTKSLSALPYIPPITYREIQGSMVTCKVSRRTFDSTANVVIRDADLDPATATLLRPGRALKVSVLSGATWAVLFQGTTQLPAVDYGDLKRNKRPTITLPAYGPGAELAAVTKKAGVSGIANLPAVLEGVRIPFKVDGSTSQVPAPVSVSSNDSATALDQVILTRDSALGYAWVNREGILYGLTDRAGDPYGTGTLVLDESDYTTLALGWEPGANRVTVILLKYNAATGETEEVTYGPYIDEASRLEFGENPAEYRVHGIADPAVYAASVLAANKTPTLKVNALRLSITDTTELTTARALIDLYQKVQVLNAEKAIDLTLRVLGIDHSIDSRGRWYVDLTFTSDDGVAAPVPVTPVDTSGGIQEGVWNVVGAAGQPAFLNGWINYGAPYSSTRFMRKNGIVYAEIMVKNGAVNTSPFTFPAGFRPNPTAPPFVAESNNTPHRIDVNANGTMTVVGQASNAHFAANISFLAEA
jgi:hypothetical protein